jgi:2-polyprenyl-3-methyl-5-hydroxy-6-metoxy-1,4-benzoquinol methylase
MSLFDTTSVCTDGVQIVLGTCFVTSGGRGDIITNDFCFGVRLDGKYTASEIFDCAVKHRPKAESVTTYHPTVSDWSLYNKYVWIPWNRLHHGIGEHIIRRCQMTSTPMNSDEIVCDYIGTKSKYEDAWTRYITTSDRITAITKFTGSIKNLRILDLGCAGGNSLAMLGAYGADVYGIECHPEMFNARNKLLDQRIVFGDALECLHVFKPASFDVVIVSMIGNVWWRDVNFFLSQVRDLLYPGGLMMLDLMQHKHVDLKSRAMYKVVMQEIDVPMKLKVSDDIAVGVKVRK